MAKKRAGGERVKGYINVAEEGALINININPEESRWHVYGLENGYNHPYPCLLRAKLLQNLYIHLLNYERNSLLRTLIENKEVMKRVTSILK